METKKELDNEEIEVEEKEEVQGEMQNEADQDFGDLILQKDNEIKDVLDKLLRLQAEFNNYKRRTDKEKSESIHHGMELIACELFPILANFERALESQDDKSDSFYQGVEMIYNQLISMLEKSSIKEIEALHKEFDPNIHNAVLMEDSEEHEAGTIIRVLEKGYMLKDKVIKHPTVIVSQ